MLVVGATSIWASWAELTCPYGGPGGRAYCSTTVAVGGLFTMGGLIVVAAGVAVTWSVGRRPVSSDGGDGWTWGQGALVTLGILVIAALVRRYWCPPGTQLTDVFPLCVGPDDRFAAGDRFWIKLGIRVAAPVVGLVVARWRMLPWPLTSALTLAVVGVPFYLVIERSVRFPF